MRKNMNLSKQAQLVAIALFHNLIKHDKVIDWVDEIIKQSEIAEEWMWEVSLSKASDYEECSYILKKQFGDGLIFEDRISFTEFVALMLCLYKEKNISLHKCCFLLMLDHDSYKSKNESSHITGLRSLILELEAYLDINENDKNSETHVTNRLEELLLEITPKNKEVINFIVNYA